MITIPHTHLIDGPLSVDLDTTIALAPTAQAAIDELGQIDGILGCADTSLYPRLALGHRVVFNAGQPGQITARVRAHNGHAVALDIIEVNPAASTLSAAMPIALPDSPGPSAP